MSGSVLRDDAGSPQYFIGMVQDLGERRVAHTLQRSMLTTQLPAVDGVELAVRYLPGMRQTEISGDWYDVIPLPDGRVGVVIGDVVGRGIEAAATMSQLRTALRAYAVEGLEPAEVVAKLHRLVDHLRVGLSTTLVYLDFDPFTREVRYVSAGHLPVLHVPADGPSRFLPGARSTPLGAAPAGSARSRRSGSCSSPGDAVLLYTDGLVERRDDGIDSRLEQLRARGRRGARRTCRPRSSTSPRRSSATTRCARTTSRCSRCASRAGDRDVRGGDRAARRASSPRCAATCARGSLRAGATASEAGDVLIAVGEACANAIEHAGAEPAARSRCARSSSGARSCCASCDHGRWRSAAARSERGHGLRLMRVLMDAIDIASGQRRHARASCAAGWRRRARRWPRRPRRRRRGAAASA